MKHFLTIPGVPLAVGSYSVATCHGNVLYTAGQIALSPDHGRQIQGKSSAEQTGQIMQNLQALLNFFHVGFDSVLLTTIFLSDISDASNVNKVYSNYFEKIKLPARQTVAVKDLPLFAKVEISMIVALNDEN